MKDTYSEKPDRAVSLTPVQSLRWVERLPLTAVPLQCTAHAMCRNCDMLVFPSGFFWGFLILPSTVTSSNYLALLHNISYFKMTFSFRRSVFLT